MAGLSMAATSTWDDSFSSGPPRFSSRHGNIYISGRPPPGQFYSRDGNVFVDEFSAQTATAHKISDDVEQYASSENLLPGWQQATSGERNYYIHEETGTTTWVRPVPILQDPDPRLRDKLEIECRGTRRDTMSDGPQFLQEVAARATVAGSHWPERARGVVPRTPGKSRCSIFTKGIAQVPRIEPKSDMVETTVRALIEEWRKNEDCVCIIENIDDKWIQALGSYQTELDLPIDFFAAQASPKDRRPIVQSAAISAMDDIIERASSFLSSLRKREDRRPVEEINEILRLASTAVRTYVERWGLSGVTSMGLDRVASCVAQCEHMLDNLANLRSRPESDPAEENAEAVETERTKNGQAAVDNFGHAIHRQIKDMEFLSLQRYFNMQATCLFENYQPGPQSHLNSEGSFFNRDIREVQSFAYSLDTQVSYIRVDKGLCLILVDSRPSRACLQPLPGSNGRSRARATLNFPHANAGSGLDIPDLLEPGEHSLYDTLRLFAADAWHADILCAEQRLPPTFADHQSGHCDPKDLTSKSYTALDPQGFLLMLSNFVWTRNIRFLETKIRSISFQDLPDADSMAKMNRINSNLHQYREELEILVSQVEHADAHVSAHLTTYFEGFPRIRQRHKATHLSPVENLSALLRRANRLDKQIQANFTILTSSFSAREGHESMRQSALATYATVIAAIYLPLTLVTGIFGMNIKGDDGFGTVPAIASFIGALAFTILVALAARWLLINEVSLFKPATWVWRKRRSTQGLSDDVEAGKEK